MSASVFSPQNAVALADGVDVDVVAATVRACPGVDDLYGGPPAGIATYLPGRRVDGVRVGRYAIEVQVRARWGETAMDIAAQIRGALDFIAAGRRIDLTLADVSEPPVLPAVADPLAVDPATNERELWTTSSSGGRGGASSSGPIIQTVAATPMSSSPA